MRLFDELNTPSESKILPIEQYFDEMELTETQKDKRKEFAESIFEIALFLFSLFSVMKEYDYIKIDFISAQLQSKYLEVARKHNINIDSHVKAYIKKFSEEIVSTTERHIDKEYFLSQDRATIIGENEAQSIIGYSELTKAIKSGYTKKKWITERDNKVRKTHREIDGLTINISEPFIVGDSLMMYAHDAITFNADEKELCGCRCATKYLK